MDPIQKDRHIAEHGTLPTRVNGTELQLPKRLIENAKERIRRREQAQKRMDEKHRQFKRGAAYNCDEAEELRAAKTQLQDLTSDLSAARDELPATRQKLKEAEQTFASARAEAKFGSGAESAVEEAKARRDQLREDVDDLELITEHFHMALQSARQRVEDAKAAAREKAQELLQGPKQALADALEEAIDAQDRIDEAVEELKFAGLLDPRRTGAKEGYHKLAARSGTAHPRGSAEAFIESVG